MRLGDLMSQLDPDNARRMRQLCQDMQVPVQRVLLDLRSDAHPSTTCVAHELLRPNPSFNRAALWRDVMRGKYALYDDILHLPQYYFTPGPRVACDPQRSMHDGVICHELAHARHHDHARAVVATVTYDAVSLGFATQLVRTLHRQLPPGPMMLRGPLLLGATVALGCGLWRTRQRLLPAYARGREKRADLEVAQRHGTAGLMAYLEERRKINRLAVQWDPDRADKIDDAGNNLLDTAHPPLTERIAYLRAA